MTNFNEYKEILEAKEVTIHHLLKYFKKNDLDFDEFGNIFVNFKKTTKKLPILVAHTDNVLGDGKRIPAYSIDKKKIFCANGTGIGFDDKAGIIGIIELWKNMPENSFRIIFTADEEVGGIGASNLDESKLDEAAFIIELDRRGEKDIIQTSGCTRLCSDSFAKKWEALGFKRATGTFTDLNEFKTKKPKIEMCNLSIGYYNPHQKTEYLNVKEFEATIEKVKRFIAENKDMVFEDNDETINYYNKKGRYNYSTLDGRRCECCNRYYGSEWRHDVEMYLCKECYEYYKDSIKEEEYEDDNGCIYKY